MPIVSRGGLFFPPIIAEINFTLDGAALTSQSLVTPEQSSDLSKSCSFEVVFLLMSLILRRKILEPVYKPYYAYYTNCNSFNLCKI